MNRSLLAWFLAAIVARMSPVWFYTCFSFHHGLFFNEMRRLCLTWLTAAAPAQFARASPWSVFPGAGVRQRSGRRPERQRAAGWAVGQWGRSTSQHRQLRLQVIQWRFASAKQHSADAREWFYIWEGTTKALFVYLFAASCAGVLQWRAEIESPCFSSRTGQKFVFCRPQHRSCWWGLLSERCRSLWRYVMWPVPVALNRTKCMQSQKRSSLWSMWSRRCFVSPPMADLHRTGSLTVPICCLFVS